ncbi:alpha-L-fucosidase [Sphingobacterium sp. ML3W]|uniref:alpha-L-fucosidase n=1 Tax=Sphingobacterium sp. ML3W TaxID=1538644 RepID=UPI00249BD03E|nr:alpha-L-fucosidase [Sphingobacterium sp. ML3W]WFA79549.1 alpha-L-fucosidase [Sphingobacterium sp. ML3W]
MNTLIFNNIRTILLLLFALAGLNLFGQPAPWFTDGKFGLFLHWGLYSQTAGDWNGHPTKGGEHFMLYERIPVKTYAKIADQFNPTGFDADRWVRMAYDAGMKYIVITAKHHDGFSMYNSAVSDYNIVRRTPWAKDPMLALAAACKKYGLKLCFYYSLGRDWENPDVPTNWPTKAGRSNTWDYPDEDAKDLNKYVENKVKPQLRELLTQYGPIGIIWFDTPELITKKQSQEIRDLIHSIQPQCIINSRIGNGLGDYAVVEQTLVSTARKNWEACITMSENWGYNRHDQKWKSPELLIRNLIEVVSKGGNLLLNVGPKGDGSWPAESEQNLQAIGAWMKVNGEALYGTTVWNGNKEVATAQVAKKESEKDKGGMKDAVNDATPKVIVSDYRFTQKGNVVYLFVRSPSTARIDIPELAKNKLAISSISLLGDRSKVKWTQGRDNLNLVLPSGQRDEIPIYVYKIEAK